MLKAPITFLVIPFCVLSCTKPGGSASESIDTVQLSHSVIAPSAEHFDPFYEKFYSDSDFQKSRLSSPMKGKRIQEDATGTIISEHWTASNWIVLRHPIQRIDTLPHYRIHGTDTLEVTHYKTSRQLSDTLVKEKVWLENSGFSFEIHYRLQQGKWFAVYCNEVNI